MKKHYKINNDRKDRIVDDYIDDYSLLYVIVRC